MKLFDKSVRSSGLGMTRSAIPVLSQNTDPQICPRQTKLLSITKMRGAGTHTVFAGHSSPLQNVIQDECLTLVLQNSVTHLISLQSLYSDSCLKA